MTRPRPHVVGIDILTQNAGRVDWSPDGHRIAFDRVGDDGFSDVWMMSPDGSDAVDLTGDHERLGLPPGIKGNPAWHPDGDWLVIQVEKPDHPGPQGLPAANPGAGIYNDLWMLRADASEAHPIHEVDISEGARGTLHPHFDSTGRRLTWSEYVGAPTVLIPGERVELPRHELYERMQLSINTMFGDWRVAEADLDGGRVGAVEHHLPGGRGFYETHAFTADSSGVLMCGNPDPFQPVTGLDILVYDLESREISRRVTFSPEAWDEHAHFSPTGSGRIVYSSSYSLEPDERYPFGNVPSAFAAMMPPRAEYWVAEPDGELWPLTHFNDPEWAHRPKGIDHVFPSDHAISPDGTAIVGFLQGRDRGPFTHRFAIAVIHLSEPL